MSKRPWLKFYPADWRGDLALRQCSLAARGLWMEFMCLMHEAFPYGHLLINGRSPTIGMLATLIGVSPKEAKYLLDELKEVGVCGVTEDGVIFSRRMIRDEERAATDKANGLKGGNAALKLVKPPDKPKPKGGVNPLDKGMDNGPDKAQKLEARDQRLEDNLPAQHLIAAREPDALAELKKSITKAFIDAHSMTINVDTFRAERWVEQGFSPGLCLAVVRECLAKNPNVSGLQYFDKAIAEAHERRPKINGNSHVLDGDGPRCDLGSGYNWPHASIKLMLSKWAEDGKSWPFFWRKTGDLTGIPDDARPPSLRGQAGNLPSDDRVEAR